MTKEQPHRLASAYTAELRERFGPAHACSMAMVVPGMSERKPYQVVGGVAIIRISGVLTNDAWYRDECEYSQIEHEVRMATDDADVRAILLHIDSPGGDTTGAFECADVLAECGRKKKMWAVADGMAYSAGYLLASQAARIFVSPVTGGVGSIGVYATHFDYSEFLKKEGIDVTLISAGEGKTDGNPYEPLAPEARKKIAAEVQRLYGEFVSRVAAGRGKTPDFLRKMGAETFHGAPSCIEAGLADAAGTCESVCMELAAVVTSDPKQFFAASADVDTELSMTGHPAMTSTKEVHMVDTTKPDAPVASVPAAPVQAAAPVAPATPAALAAPATAAVAPAAPVAQAAPVAEPAVPTDAAKEIAGLCMAAGKPALAAGFIVAGKTVAAVATELLTAMVAEDEATTIRSRTLPEQGTAAQGETNNGLIAACEAIGKNMIAAHSGNGGK
jgi:signal peptide peptidase SppA